MVMEAVLAALTGVAVLWLVLQPIVAPAPETAPMFDPPDPEETARGRALLALKEIEFDRATAKLSDEDYGMLKTRYEAAAVATLDGCASCGAAMASEDQFCARCGSPRDTR
jgi:hypothetical protein